MEREQPQFPRIKHEPTWRDLISSEHEPVLKKSLLKRSLRTSDVPFIKPLHLAEVPTSEDEEQVAPLSELYPESQYPDLHRGLNNAEFYTYTWGRNEEGSDVEPLSFDLDSEEGIDQARQYAEGTYAQAVQAHGTFEGKWPNKKTYPELYKSIEQQRTAILGALAKQEDFLLKRTIKDNGAEVTALIVELDLMVNALYDLINEDLSRATEETVVAGGALVRTSEAVLEVAVKERTASEVEEDQLIFDYWWQASQNQRTDGTISPEQRRQEIWEQIDSMTPKARQRVLRAIQGESTRETVEEGGVGVETPEELAGIQTFVLETWESLSKYIDNVYDGNFPSAECEQLYKDIDKKYQDLKVGIQEQAEFFNGNGSDQGEQLQTNITSFADDVDLLYATIKNARANGWDGTAYEATPKVENKEGVLTAQEFETFKQRIHRRQENIDTALKYFESNIIAPEHQHYLDDLVICRKAITDIVVAGLEEAKAQDATISEKVYSAELVTRAEPYLSQITDIMYALEDLYAPQPASTGKEDEVDEQKPETATAEPRVLSGAEEMKLLEAFFLPNMDGQDDAEKLALLRKQLREMPLEEWTDALLDARDAFTDEELEVLLGPVVTPTPVSGGVAPAPVSPAPFIPGAATAAAAMPGVPPQPAAPKAPEQAPAAAPEKTFTPEQQATRDKWLAARRKVLYIDPETLERQREAAAQERYKDMTTEEMLEILSEAQRQQILGDYMLDLIGGDGTKGGNPRMRELYVSATDDEKQALLRTRDQVIADSSEAEMEYILGLRLSRLTVEERTKLFQNELISETEVPLQSQYQNKLTEYYEGFKTEGSGLQRFGKRIAATFGFKPELPPELDATREAMFDATAEYTKETREMLRLRKEAGKTAGEKLSRRYSESRQKQLLEEYVLEKSGTYDPAGNFTSLKFLYDQASTDEERAIILAKRDEDLAKLTDEQKDGLLQQKTEALIQRRYEKMLGRSVLMGTFERQLEAQRQVTEDLAFHAPEVLKKHKRKISLFAAGAIGGITGGASSAVMGVTRALAGGLLGASIGGFVGEKWKNRIERETEKGTGAVLDSLAQRLSKDSITASELEDTYQELKKIYEKADSQTRTRIAGLMAMALAIGLATGQAFEFGAESMGLVDTPDVGGSAEVTGSGEVPAGGVTDSVPDTAQDGAGGTEGGEAAAGEKLGAVASDGTTSPEAGQAVGGGTEGNAPAAETLKPYIAERGDNMWDILEGQTDAEKLPFMGQVDPDKLQGLLKEVELRLDADPTLRTEIGFGESSHDLSEGATVNVDRLNEVALKIAEEKGMLADANVAEAAAAADASPDAMPTDSVETAAADAAPEQPTPTTEAAVEDAIANAEAAADKAADAAGAIKEVTAPDGTTFSYPYEAGSNQDGAAGIESASLENEGPLDTAAAKVASDSNSTTPAEQGTRVEGLVGAEKVNAYATAYDGGPFDRGPLAFENQLVKPYLGSVEGTPDNGFLGLFKQPPPPSMGGYALFQHVPLREMAELNSLPDDQLFSTLAEKYHAENPEQFSVWVEKLNDMQGRDVFNLNQTPDLTLADAVALDVINSKTTIV